jgi:hypothetical protein
VPATLVVAQKPVRDGLRCGGFELVLGFSLGEQLGADGRDGC